MKSITIVGSGASGTILAINLIKNYKGSSKLEINLIERDPEKLNLGVAYSTEEFEHLLNVKAQNMSIFKDEPDHLINWLKKYGYNYSANDFIPRKIWGSYLKYHYKKSIQDKSDNIVVNVILDEVINLEKVDNNYNIELSNSNIKSDIVILALGHISPSEMPEMPKLKKYFRTPWQDLYTQINENDHILLLGSGLTSYDVILSLRERKHKGKIYSISRRGFLPITHKTHLPHADFHHELEGKDINQIFHIVKNHIKSSQDPRAVVDSLRAYTPQIWKNLNDADKSRFLRHIQPLWNSVRHRVPQETENKLSQMIQEGQLEFIQGRILKVDELEDSMKVTVSDKSGNTTELFTSQIINCIGPESNYKRINLPLIKNLILNKSIKPDLLSIKTTNFNVIDGFGNQNDSLFAIGPLLKGELYESTAIPEIRAQSERLSKILLDKVKMLRPVKN